jgi:hypothetical protein
MSTINISPEDLQRVNILSRFNDLGMIFFNEGSQHVMKNNSNMIRVTLDTDIPVQFGTAYKKLDALIKIKTVDINADRSLDLIETNNDFYYIKSENRYQSTQIPTEPKKYLTSYIPNDELALEEGFNNAFEMYVDKVERNTICEIFANENTPSLFERFNFMMYDSLGIENDNIHIYQDNDNNIVIEISKKSVNEGTLPSGSIKNKTKMSDQYVRSIICNADDINMDFPKDKVFSISHNIYRTMQGSGRQFSLKIGSFEMLNRTFLGLYLYSDDIEYFNVLGEV